MDASEPRIHFARSSDGVAIAHWTIGKGLPIVHMPWLPWSHTQLEWLNPEMNRWYSVLGAESQLVRYDVRGTGLSDRDVSDVSCEAQIRDLEAVLDHLAIEKCILLGVFNSGPAALQFAARHPERLAGLVLWCSFASGRDYFSSPQVSAIRALINDWHLYTETGAHAFVGWGAGNTAHEVAGLMRESVRPEMAMRFLQEIGEADCSALLPQIDVPTLVLHPRSFQLIDVALARGIAAGIPGARFVAVEGDSMAPTLANTEPLLRAIRDMLPEKAPPAPQAPALSPENLAPLRLDRKDLTAREVEILRLVAQGKSSREIALSLVLSPRTIERHIANIYAKIDVANRAQATAYALSNGILSE